VPAASTITQILRRYRYLPAEPPPRQNLTVGSFRAEAPNVLWQIDFKGDFPLTGGGRCFPLGLLDDYSRYNLCLQACGNQNTDTVADRLHAVFGTVGLPEAILADNGPPWGSSNRQYRWTPLQVWLLDLGVRVIHSRPRHPQTLGKEERFHSTIAKELLNLKAPWHDLDQLQGEFDRWRLLYNDHRPHESLDNNVPADYYQPSPRPYPTSIDAHSYPDHYVVCVVDSAAGISHRGVRYKVGKPFKQRPVALDPATGDIYYRTQRIRSGVNHVPERA
jgi:transposase InsO family protein